jgi:hypothetical protein
VSTLAQASICSVVSGVSSLIGSSVAARRSPTDQQTTEADRASLGRLGF